MIKGINKLSEEQIEHMKRVNRLHTDCVGSDYKAAMEIVEVWLNENNTVKRKTRNSPGLF